MAREAFVTCDWLGCINATNESSDEYEEWYSFIGGKVVDFSAEDFDLEDHIHLDLCPEHANIVVHESDTETETT